jgi:DNA polymerase-3 subunit epsilon
MVNLGYWWLKQQRNWLAKRCHQPLLHEFLSEPLPDKQLPWQQVDLLVVDFETTGLDPKQHQIISIGAVPIRQGLVQLHEAYYQVVQQPIALTADNVAIHHITDTELAQGVSLAQAITDLLEQLKGKIMVAHFATIELTFLRQACQSLWQIAPRWPVIDTLALEKRWLDQHQKPYDANELRLPALRQRYHLPEFTTHHALTDAIATGELLLAQLAHQYGNETVSYSKLLR